MEKFGRGTTSSVSFERSLKKRKKRKKVSRSCRCDLFAHWLITVPLSDIPPRDAVKKRRKKKDYVRAAVIFARNVIGYPFLESHTIYERFLTSCFHFFDGDLLQFPGKKCFLKHEPNERNNFFVH